jgi:hypothetical protein
VAAVSLSAGEVEDGGVKFFAGFEQPERKSSGFPVCANLCLCNAYAQLTVLGPESILFATEPILNAGVTSPPEIPKIQQTV